MELIYCFIVDSCCICALVEAVEVCALWWFVVVGMGGQGEEVDGWVFAEDASEGALKVLILLFGEGGEESWCTHGEWYGCGIKRALVVLFTSWSDVLIVP